LEQKEKPLVSGNFKTLRKLINKIRKLQLATEKLKKIVVEEIFLTLIFRKKNRKFAGKVCLLGL